MTTLDTASAWLRIAEAAAKHAGSKLRERRAEWIRVDDATEHDIKITADRFSEEIIIKNLRDNSPFPILSEEAGTIPAVTSDADDGTRWIVDPLDGSLNYFRNIPLCCVSIALIRQSAPWLGVIYDFNRDEMFAGIADTVAWLNGSPITVSDINTSSEAVLGSGFPSALDHSEENLLDFVGNVRAYRKVRGLGSAALTLAFVACGRLDVYHEKQIRFWDVAAGMAIVSGAGGKTHVIAASDDNHTLELFASNSGLSSQVTWPY